MTSWKETVGKKKDRRQTGAYIDDSGYWEYDPREDPSSVSDSYKDTATQDKSEPSSSPKEPDYQGWFTDSPPNSVELGETFSFTVKVRNTGDAKGRETFSLAYKSDGQYSTGLGNVFDQFTKTLEPGERQTYTWRGSLTGPKEGVSTDIILGEGQRSSDWLGAAVMTFTEPQAPIVEDTTTQQPQVQEPVVEQTTTTGTYSVNDITAPSSVQVGETFTVSARLCCNGGDCSSTYATIDVGNKRVLSTNVQLSNTCDTVRSNTLKLDNEGTYTITVRIGDDSMQQTVRAEAATPANLQVTDIWASPEIPTAGERVYIGARVSNTGDVQGTKDFPLSINGNQIDTLSVTVGPGEQRDVGASFICPSTKLVDVRLGEISYQLQVKGSDGSDQYGDTSEEDLDISTGTSDASASGGDDYWSDNKTYTGGSGGGGGGSASPWPDDPPATQQVDTTSDTGGSFFSMNNPVLLGALGLGATAAFFGGRQ